MTLPEPHGLEVSPHILDLDEEEFRRLGYWVVDRTIEHLRTLPSRPPVSVGDFDELIAQLGGAVPQSGNSVDSDLELLADVALENMQHGDHPRYFARVPGPSSMPGVLGEWLATGMQSIASSWGGGSGTATLELVVLDWLRDSLGLAVGSEGVLVSGGSMANITALITARAARGPGVIYLTEQTHSSIHRGITAIGQPADLVRSVAVDPQFRLDPAALDRAIREDRSLGKSPMCVVATVGSTNTGAVDELDVIADICADNDLWLHVDGAYGGPVALLPDRGGITGLDRADSFVLDPHKWLFQPYDVGCLWVAEPGALHHAFAMHPEYLADVQGGPVDLHNRSLELSRRSRAVKLWLTIRTYGIPRLAAAVSRGIALAEHAQRRIEEDPRLAVVTPAQLGIVTFRATDRDDNEHSRAATSLTADGFAALTTTVLHDRSALRLCTINPRTTTEDIDQTIHRLSALLSTD